MIYMCEVSAITIFYFIHLFQTFIRYLEKTKLQRTVAEKIKKNTTCNWTTYHIGHATKQTLLTFQTVDPVTCSILIFYKKV